MTSGLPYPTRVIGLLHTVVVDAGVEWYVRSKKPVDTVGSNSDTIDLTTLLHDPEHVHGRSRTTRTDWGVGT